MLQIISITVNLCLIVTLLFATFKKTKKYAAEKNEQKKREKACAPVKNKPDNLGVILKDPSTGKYVRLPSDPQDFIDELRDLCDKYRINSITPAGQGALIGHLDDFFILKGFNIDYYPI